MKLRVWSVVFALLLWLTPVLAASRVDSLSIFSSTFGRNERVNVYLPDGYSPSSHYPVIYFLHGLGYNQDGYNLVPVLDGLIAAHLIHPVIFVRANGNCGPYAGSMWTNSLLYGNWENYFVNDVVPYIDAHYATLPSRANRMVMGHSMGGFGAVTIALKHSDMFANVASLSGFLSLQPFNYFCGAVCAENGGVAPYTYPPLPAHFFTIAAYTAAGAFSPNFTAPPYMVDFPLDANGLPIPATFDHWLTHMPPYTARHATGLQPLAIYMDCGTNDELGFYPMNLAFRDTLTALGIPFHFESFTGTHSDHLAQRFQTALMSMDHTLPVELASFDVAPVVGGLEVRWTTASEIDNASFELQRDHAQVASLPGAGNSSSANVYTWRDAAVTAGRSYTYTLYSISLNGTRAQVAERTIPYSETVSTAARFELAQNYPNPFNPSTTVAFDLARASTVSLTVYNALGEKVATLAQGPLTAGHHEATFDAQRLPSGVYLCRIQAGEFTATRKMLLMK